MSEILSTYFGNASTTAKGVSVVIGVGVCSVSTCFVLNKIKNATERRRLKQLIQQKQNERNESFEELRRKYQLTSDRNHIVQLSVDNLLAKLQSRELSSVRVLEAYIAKALEVTDEFNCITEFVPQAVGWAEELDKLPKPIGSLHGLPFAIKDDTSIEGMDTTIGFATNLYKPVAESSAFVVAVRRLGAVPFCRTNVPQSILSYGSDNPIFGTTLNCLNTKCGPGGSSSGSGCIVGAGGSPVAEGTDIGGSGRIPAHFNGICSIRPTVNRLSGKGIVQCLPNVMGMSGVPCVMAKRSNIVASVFQSLVEGNLQNEIDPMAVPISWRNEIYESKHSLRIGYFTSVPVFPAMGDTEGTILKAKSALETLGHTLVPFQIPDSFNYSMVLNSLYLADDGKYIKERLKYEDISTAMAPIMAALSKFALSRKIFGFLSGQSWLPFMHSKRIQLLSPGGLQAKESWQLWETYGKRRDIINEITSQMQTQKLDLILGPVFPFPALRLDDSGALLLAALGYSAFWNLVDFPAGVVTFGKESGENLSQYDNEGDIMLKLAQEGIKGSIGMPIGVTIIGKPFQEELVLRAMVELDAKAQEQMS